MAAALSSYYCDTLEFMNPTLSFNASLFHGQPEVADVDTLLGFCDPTFFTDNDLFEPSAELVVEDFIDPCDIYLSFNDHDLYYQSQASDGAFHVPSLPNVGLLDPFPEFAVPQATCNVSVPGFSPELPVPQPVVNLPAVFSSGLPEFTVPQATTGCNLDNNTSTLPELLPEFTVSPSVISSTPVHSCCSPEFTVPQPASAIWCNTEKKSTENGSLSAQSVAARERRKKISRKTQELGRLIPGGNRMNTAEMLQSASKYVKFLQAQVGILGLMASAESKIGSNEHLQVLLASPIVQEKLYGEAKCVVPKEMIEALAENFDIKASPFISTELNHFIQSLG